MIVKKTNYGLEVTIPEQCDEYGQLLNSCFTYWLRQVRTINHNDPDEQPLLDRLEKDEKELTDEFLTLAEEMEKLFIQLRTREDWGEWEKEHGDFNYLYHDRMDNLAYRINGISFRYADESTHGYCI